MTRKGVVTGLLVAATSTAAVVAYASLRPRPRARYVTAAAERVNLAARVTATGTLSALVTVQVGSQISGRIQELGADFNARVTRGQVLARIDPQLLEAALTQARAELAASLGQQTKARTVARNAAARFDRAQMLAGGRLIAEADLDQARADADAARADVAAAGGNVEQARAQVQSAKVNLAYATISSPVDGIVISRNVDVGQTVAASLQAPTLFTIAGDLTKMQVDTSVAEADVGKIHPAMGVEFAVDAYPSTRFRGVVREVRNAPQSVQGIVTYDAVVDVDNADLRLKPGMTAHVSFTYSERRDALSVPNAALRYRPTGEDERTASRTRGRRGQSPDGDPPATDDRTLWVLRNGSPTAVSLRIGISNGAWTEIVGGELLPGEQVVVAGADLAEAGGERPTQGARLY